MKKILYLIALTAAVALTSCGQAPKYQISGHLDGVASDTLIVYVQASSLFKTERADTIALTAGDFAFNLQEEDLRLVTLLAKPMPGEGLGTGGTVSFFMIPGQQVVINGTMSDYTLSGSPYYEEYDAFRKEIELPLNQKAMKLSEERQAGLDAGLDADSVNEAYKNNQEALSKEWNETLKGYIKDHPDSDVAAFICATLNDDEAKALLTERALNGVMTPVFKAYDDMKQAQEEREKAAENIQPGMEAPDFTLMDINGNPLTLSSLRGKYVVLDFWGSWCGWCIKGFPEMKEAYAKYKDKATFLGIACNDTEEKWKAAVEKYELPWLQVINSKENDVSTLYAIQGYPTKMVIDPQGNIVNIVVGEDPTFYTILNDLFKQS